MPKPTPFTRPSITLGSSEKREWRHVTVWELEEGDQIAEFGELESKTEVVSSNGEYAIRSTLGRTERLPGSTKLHAYVKVREAD